MLINFYSQSHKDHKKKLIFYAISPSPCSLCLREKPAFWLWLCRAELFVCFSKRSERVFKNHESKDIAVSGP